MNTKVVAISLLALLNLSACSQSTDPNFPDVAVYKSATCNLASSSFCD